MKDSSSAASKSKLQVRDSETQRLSDVSLELVCHSNSRHVELMRFLNAQLRPGKALALETEYPSVFQPFPGGFSLLARVRGQIAAHVAFVVREYSHADFKVRLGLLGSVVTSTLFRRLGLGSRVIESALEQLRNRKVELAVLWSDLADFYERRDFVPFGEELNIAFDPQNICTSAVEVQEVCPKSWATQAWRHYMRQPGKLDRSLEEQKAMMKIHGVRVFVSPQPSGHPVFIVINKGEDFHHYIHEWAGEGQALAGLIGAVQTRFFPHHPLTLIGPAHQIDPSLRQVGSQTFKGILGMGNLLDASALQTQYLGMLKKQGLPFELKKSFEGKQTLEIKGHCYPFESPKEKLTVLFESHENRPHFPLFLWGFDSI